MKIRNYLAILSLALIAITCFTSIEAKISKFNSKLNSKFNKMNKIQRVHRTRAQPTPTQPTPTQPTPTKPPFYDDSDTIEVDGVTYKVHKEQKAFSTIETKGVLYPTMQRAMYESKIQYKPFLYNGVAYPTDSHCAIVNDGFDCNEKGEERKKKKNQKFTQVIDLPKSTVLQIMLGALEAITPDFRVYIDKCVDTLPKHEENYDKDEEEKNPMAGEKATFWINFLKVLKTSVNVVCTAKDYIMNIIEKSWEKIAIRLGKIVAKDITKSKPVTYTKRRLFLAAVARRNRRRFANKSVMDFFKNVFTKPTEFIVEKANQYMGSDSRALVSEGIQYVTNVQKRSMKVAMEVYENNKLVKKVVDWSKQPAEDLIKYINKTIEEKMKPIWQDLNTHQGPFVDWLLNSKLIKRIIDYLKCQIGGLLGAYKLVTTVMKFGATVISLASPLAPLTWLKLVVDLICNWEEFKKAVENITYFFKNKAETDRYYKLGKGIGNLIKAFA